MRIAWSSQAERDINEIFDYLIEDDVEVAQRIYETVRQKVELLTTQPGLGRPGRLENTRELVIARTPHIVAYTIDSATNVVVILRVLHSARKWPNDME